MKKVVLLAGVVAAGMAVAPVAANAAAPKAPEVLTYTDQTPYQEYEHYYHVLANRHTELELMKQEVQAAIDYLADSTKPAPKDDYKDMSAESLALILGDIQDQIDDLTALQFALESHYNTLSDSQKQDDTYDNAAWNKAVEDAITYVTTKVTSDQFESLLDTYKDFDAQHKIWEEYDEWYYGTTAGVQTDGSDNGFIDNFGKYQTTDKYKEVDDTDDVYAKVNTIQTNQSTFEMKLVEPTLDGEGKIVDGINDTLAGELATAKSGLLADFNEATDALGALNTLVNLYHSDQAALNTGTDAVTVGDKTVHSLKAIVDGYGTGDSAVKGYDKTIDPTAGDYLNSEGDYSHYYATKIQTAQTTLNGKIDAAKDFIETFDATDAAAWRDNTDPNYQKDEGTNFTDEAGYKTQAVALLDEIQTLVEEYNDLVQAALDNVEACNKLIAAEAVSQGKMDDLRGMQMDIIANNGTISSGIAWNKHVERVYEPTLDISTNRGYEGAGSSAYVYRPHIQKLQQELQNVASSYNLNMTTDRTDIHDLIRDYFDKTFVVDGEDKDATYYEELMTQDKEGVKTIFGEFNDKVAKLSGQVTDNENYNKANHEIAEALGQHINDMRTVCVGYDDVAAGDFTVLGAARFYNNGTCEDGRNYLGYRNLWRGNTAGTAEGVRYFVGQEVEAYNAFNPADDSAGAKAWNENEAGPLRFAIDKSIELLWNHIATVQCNAHLADVDTKMKTEYGNAKDLDKVCIDNATVWDWNDDATRTCVCEENDTKENPCGWCEPTTKGLLKDIVDAYKEKVEDLDTAHNGDGTDEFAIYAPVSTEKPVGLVYPGVGNVKELVGTFKAYEEAAAGTDGTIDTWYKAFEKADEDHDKKLQDLKDEATQYVHEYIHEVVGDMSLALTNYEAGDIAAANLWAQNLENRTFKVYKELGAEGPVYTDEGLDLDLDGATDSFSTFAEYVDAVRAADAIYTAKIQELFDLHKWTELRKIADRAKDVHPATDYQKAVDTNRTARIALEDLLAAKKAELEAAINTVDETKIYSTTTNPMADPSSPMYVPGAKNDFTALTDATVTEDTDYKAALKALADEATAIENAYNDGKAGDWYQGGVEEANKQKGYEFKGEDIAAAIDAYVAAIAAAEQLYRENAAALAKFQEELKTVAATKLGIDGVLANADVYDVITPDATDDADDVLSKTGIVAAADQAYSDLFTTETADTHLPLEFAKGELKAHEAIHDGHMLDLTDAVKAYEEAVLKAINFKAKNVADYNELMDLFNNAATDLKLFVDELALTDEIYDVDGHKDLTAIKKALADLQDNTDAAEIDFAQVQAALEAALANGTVTATKADLEDQIGQLSEGVSDLRTELKGYVDFYKAEHALAADYAEQLANLEVLFKSVVPGDIYDDRTDSEDQDPSAQDMKVIKTLVEEIYKDVEGVKTGLIPTEAAAIDADLAAATVQAHKTTHETALANIETKIKALQTAVNDFEKFKADNLAKAQNLREQFRDLKAQLDAIVVDGVYADGTDQLDADYINGLIDDMRGADETDNKYGLTYNINELERDLAKGDVVYYNTSYYEDEIAARQAELDNIREVLADAKAYYLGNYTEYDNLKDAAQALVLDIKATLAKCLCDECNGEDNAAVKAILDKVEGTTAAPGLKDAIEASMWDTKDIAAHEKIAVEGVDTYKKQLEDLAAELGVLKADINNHSEKVKADNNAYNVLQKALVDVDTWMTNVQLEEGFENFAVRDDHCSNPDVKYFNELSNDVQALKDLIEEQHSHAGGHVCEENKIDDMKKMKVLIQDAKTLIAAIQANEAAKVILDAQFEEIADLVDDAVEFWAENYDYRTLADLAETIAKWNGTLTTPGKLQTMYDAIQDKYQHGSAAYDWTEDHEGKDFIQDVKDDVQKQKDEIAADRNTAANIEATYHVADVEGEIATVLETVKTDLIVDGIVDPFVQELYSEFLKHVGEEGTDENSLKALLQAIDDLRKEAFAAGTAEDAINIDNRSTEDGIHQMLEDLSDAAADLLEQYQELFEDAHHLTNGKTIYSDQEFFTLGFFREANEGKGEQAEEMFKEVEIRKQERIMILQGATATDGDDAGFSVTPQYYAVNSAVLVNGQKKNELTFSPVRTAGALTVKTLAPGDAMVCFYEESIKVSGARTLYNWWTTKHPVTIAFKVAAPVVEEGAEVNANAKSNKLIVRVTNPVDLTYMIKGLEATTETGSFTFDDVIYNETMGQLEFELPEGSKTVELPEGFFTFRTAENSIARSAACTVVVGGATSIEGLIAMGEKAQIFDLQGRRVKAEALISGNTYVVNGEKVMVK